MPTPSTATIARPTGLPRSAARAAAEDMVQRYARAAGIDLAPAAVELGSGARVAIDGVAADGSVFVEAHGTPGPMRDVDLVLVSQDVFKLALLRSEHPDAHAVVLVPDEESRTAVAGRVRRTPAAGLVEIRVCP